MFCGDGELTDSHAEWMQDSRHWSLFYYHHVNAVTYGTRTYALEVGDIVFFSPGVACSHALTGPGTHFDFMGFDLPATAGIRAAIPHVARAMQFALPQLRKASNRIVDGKEPACAFVWNLLWTVAQSPSLFRESEVLYVAEDFILRNIHRKFSVDEIADATKVSGRTLLKVFREQPGLSVQEFVLRRRVQEATRLLLSTNLPIKEIAPRVGISDLQYFNKTIRTMTGMSPTRVRENRKSER
jgi:AraC-like DNA-binding protein